jgi:hypothetical protein
VRQAGDPGVADDGLVDAGFLVVDKVEVERGGMGIIDDLVDEDGLALVPTPSGYPASSGYSKA